MLLLYCMLYFTIIFKGYDTLPIKSQESTKISEGGNVGSKYNTKSPLQTKKWSLLSCRNNFVGLISNSPVKDYISNTSINYIRIKQQNAYSNVYSIENEIIPTEHSLRKKRDLSNIKLENEMLGIPGLSITELISSSLEITSFLPNYVSETEATYQKPPEIGPEESSTVMFAAFSENTLPQPDFVVTSSEILSETIPQQIITDLGLTLPESSSIVTETEHHIHLEASFESTTYQSYSTQESIFLLSTFSEQTTILLDLTESASASVPGEISTEFGSSILENNFHVPEIGSAPTEAISESLLQENTVELKSQSESAPPMSETESSVNSFPDEITTLLESNLFTSLSAESEMETSNLGTVSTVILEESTVLHESSSLQSTLTLQNENESTLLELTSKSEYEGSLTEPGFSSQEITNSASEVSESTSVSLLEGTTTQLESSSIQATSSVTEIKTIFTEGPSESTTGETFNDVEYSSLESTQLETTVATSTETSSENKPKEDLTTIGSTTLLHTSLLSESEKESSLLAASYETMNQGGSSETLSSSSVNITTSIEHTEAATALTFGEDSVKLESGVLKSTSSPLASSTISIRVENSTLQELSLSERTTKLESSSSRTTVATTHMKSRHVKKSSELLKKGSSGSVGQRSNLRKRISKSRRRTVTKSKRTVKKKATDQHSTLTVKTTFTPEVTSISTEIYIKLKEDTTYMNLSSTELTLQVLENTTELSTDSDYIQEVSNTSNSFTNGTKGRSRSNNHTASDLEIETTDENNRTTSTAVMEGSSIEQDVILTVHTLSVSSLFESDIKTTKSQKRFHTGSKYQNQSKKSHLLTSDHGQTDYLFTETDATIITDFHTSNTYFLSTNEQDETRTSFHLSEFFTESPPTYSESSQIIQLLGKSDYGDSNLLGYTYGPPVKLPDEENKLILPKNSTALASSFSSYNRFPFGWLIFLFTICTFIVVFSICIMKLVVLYIKISNIYS